MTILASWAAALPAILVLSLAAWALCTARRNAGLVDIFWSLFFVVAAAIYALDSEAFTERALIVLALVVLWAVRLAGYLAWRNWDEPEDRRYREMRERHAPRFALKSLYLVFGLQAVLAWLISAPLFAAVSGSSPLNILDLTGALLVLSGIVFESVADAQLAAFKADPGNRGKVMDRGLWRYTRHPNYFGEFCVWWGFWLLALAAGRAWTVFAPLLITFMLLRVSGVTLLEKDIAERRPAYRDYKQRTNAFFPGPPKRA
jgi:steroid 5-alpha reductase family enzyme